MTLDVFSIGPLRVIERSVSSPKVWPFRQRRLTVARDIMLCSREVARAKIMVTDPIDAASDAAADEGPNGYIHMNNVLQIVGASAALIFAAWIFLSYLQQRFTTAYAQYRALINEFRQHEKRDERRRRLLDQILEYKLRCQQRRLATNLGVSASIALTSSIICGALSAIADKVAAFHYLSAGLSILGLLLMIWAAGVVLIENIRLQLIIESELSDVPELVQAARDTHRVGALAHKA